MENSQFGFIVLISGIVLFCLLAIALKWLTWSGGFAAFILALILIFSGGGIMMFYLPMVLLVGGTLLSKLNRDDKEKEGRNATQVIANGGIGVACLAYVICFGGDFNFACYAFDVSFAISICDTFSSETGKYFNGTTIDILTFKSVRKGLSGGISAVGTLGGIFGLLLCCLFLQPGQSCYILSVFGFSGMLLDSVLGSKFQAKYISASGDIEENKSLENKLYKGYTWCTNDVVNILSNALMVGLFVSLKNAGLF